MMLGVFQDLLPLSQSTVHVSCWLGNNLVLKVFIFLSRDFGVADEGLPIFMLSKKHPFSYY